MPNNQELSSLNKAIDILISVCSGISRIADIERKLGYNKTTIYRVLNTFERKQIIIKNQDTHQYFPGHNLFSLLAEPFKIHQVLIHCAQSEMEELRDRFDETVALMISQGANRFLLKAVHNDRQIRFFSRVGMLGPLYDGVAGRALLAQFEEPELEALLKKVEFPTSNPDTPKNLEDLKKEIKRIRRQQYGTSYRADSDGVMAVAVPIPGYSCPVAMVTAGFEKRIREKHPLIIEAFKTAASCISDQLKAILSP